MHPSFSHISIIKPLFVPILPFGNIPLGRRPKGQIGGSIEGVGVPFKAEGEQPPLELAGTEGQGACVVHSEATPPMVAIDRFNLHRQHIVWLVGSF